MGVLLDFCRGIVLFLINDEQQGPVAFNTLEGMYYPAISINRNVQVTFISLIHFKHFSTPQHTFKERNGKIYLKEFEVKTNAMRSVDCVMMQHTCFQKLYIY